MMQMIPQDTVKSTLVENLKMSGSRSAFHLIPKVLDQVEGQGQTCFYGAGFVHEDTSRYVSIKPLIVSYSNARSFNK